MEFETEMDIVDLGGVFGIASGDGPLVYLLRGHHDDEWDIMGCYHKDWIPGIIAALRRV